MNKSNRSITGLAEISLRVHDLARMRQFYEQVIGLRVLKENTYSGGTVVFYAVGPGDDNLALFEETLMDWYTREKSDHIDPKGTTLAHFALGLALDAFESEKKRLEQLGVEIIESSTSGWMRCRMFYFCDPEGNLIEFKSHDEGVQ